MKFTRKILLAALTSSFIVGCDKKDNNSNTTNNNQLQYSVNGLSDIQVTQYRDTTFLLPVGLNYVSGNQETVTMRVDEIPANCTVSPTSISGIPSFATLLSFHVQALTAGNLPVKVSVTTSSGSTKTYSFNLVCASNPYCRDIYLDTFVVVDSAYFKTSGSYLNTTTYTDIGFAVAGSTSKILLGADKVNIDCSNSTITTDSVTFPNGNYVTRGTGSRTSNRLDYEYFYYDKEAPDLIRRVRHAVRK